MMYLIGGSGQHIGPFESREDVERFIGMMALCGEDWGDNTIVEGGREDSSGQDPAQVGPFDKPWKNAYRLKLVGRRH